MPVRVKNCTQQFLSFDPALAGVFCLFFVFTFLLFFCFYFDFFNFVDYFVHVNSMNWKLKEKVFFFLNKHIHTQTEQNRQITTDSGQSPDDVASAFAEDGLDVDDDIDDVDSHRSKDEIKRTVN